MNAKKVNINYIDLFSGIGGFALGAYWAGFRCDRHFFSEIDKWAIELYRRRFPDAENLGDITKIDWEKLKKDNPGDWILTGGFPCQDISIAGKRKGLIDENGNKTRSGLWFEYLRGISILRPRFAIVENVGQLISNGLDVVLGTISEIGYNAEWQIISARDVGAQHLRKRVWIVAYPADAGHLSRRCEKQEIIRRSEKGRETYNTIERSNNTRQTPDTASERFKLSRVSRDRRTGFKNDCNRKGFEKIELKETGYETESGVCGVAYGIPKTMDRLRGLGNAIVPHIAELIFKHVMEAWN